QQIGGKKRFGGGRVEARELRELERALLGHAGVKEAVVLAFEGPQARQRRVAYVVACSPGREPTERFTAQLQEHLRNQPEFHAVPDEWLVLESLPRMAGGKVDRKALPIPKGPGQRAYEA